MTNQSLYQLIISESSCYSQHLWKHILDQDYQLNPYPNLNAHQSYQFIDQWNNIIEQTCSYLFSHLNSTSDYDTTPLFENTAETIVKYVKQQGFEHQLSKSVWDCLNDLFEIPPEIETEIKKGCREIFLMPPIAQVQPWNPIDLEITQKLLTAKNDLAKAKQQLQRYEEIDVQLDDLDGEIQFSPVSEITQTINQQIVKLTSIMSFTIKQIEQTIKELEGNPP